MTSTRRSALAAGALSGLLALGLLTAADDSPPFAAECALVPDGQVEIVVGEVACQRLDSRFMGAVSAFSYYVPPACAPRHTPGRVGPVPTPTDPACPVLYLLHGTGGDHGVGYMLGSPGQADVAYVRALTSGPAVNPATVGDPWTHADPDTWVPRTPST